MSSGEATFLAGPKLRLRPLGATDASPAYLGWLNDPDVLRWRGPKGFATSAAQLAAWLEGLPAGVDLVLAIELAATGRHVGNIALNTIAWTHGTAELSIMIGAKDVWGMGVGAEAIQLVTDHAFGAMGLRRLWAESPNPAFNRAVQRQGWTQEGIKRAAFLLDGNHVDIVCWGLLVSEWHAKKAAK
jgi:ribosomal-protein-alanine N-acetyltransferase